ncbi:hypothetical protein SVIOM342S_04724 [Streptomyces violaceorubidus]
MNGYAYSNGSPVSKRATPPDCSSATAHGWATKDRAAAVTPAVAVTPAPTRAVRGGTPVVQRNGGKTNLGNCLSRQNTAHDRRRLRHRLSPGRGRGRRSTASKGSPPSTSGGKRRPRGQRDPGRQGRRIRGRRQGRRHLLVQRHRVHLGGEAHGLQEAEAGGPGGGEEAQVRIRRRPRAIAGLRRQTRGPSGLEGRHPKGRQRPVTCHSEIRLRKGPHGNGLERQGRRLPRHALLRRRSQERRRTPSPAPGPGPSPDSSTASRPSAKSGAEPKPSATGMANPPEPGQPWWSSEWGRAVVAVGAPLLLFAAPSGGGVAVGTSVTVGGVTLYELAA